MKGRGEVPQNSAKTGKKSHFSRAPAVSVSHSFLASLWSNCFLPNSSSTLLSAHYQILISSATEGSRERSPGLRRQLRAQLREQPRGTSHSRTTVVTTADKVITATPLETGNLKSTGLHCWECCWLRVNYQILNSRGRESPANRSTTNLPH